MNTYTSSPTTLFIQITTECNYRCRYCHMWMTRDDPSALTTQDKLFVLDDFAALNASGQVVLTGGEPMAKLDEFIALSARCRELTLLCASNTNASLITIDNIDRLLTSGPRHLVISLDSHDPAVHDFARGVAGSHAHVVHTIRTLIARRAELGLQNEVLVFTNSVLFDRNIHFLVDYVTFAEGLGLDGVTFQMLSPTFYKQAARDVFFEDHFPRDRPAAIDSLQRLIASLDAFPVVKTHRRDLEWMQMYIANPQFLTDPVCGSHERNMMVDLRGEVQLCFNMRQLLGHSIGNVKTTPLSTLWRSPTAAGARAVMSDCRRNCGMLNCHRKSA